MSLQAQPGSEVSLPGDRRPIVLSVAFPYAAMGPKAVGGAEVVCSQVEAALPSLGFRSVVVAHAASLPQGQLYPTQVPSGRITDEVRAVVEARHQANLDSALREHAVSLVHMHGLDFFRYQIPSDVPVLVTLHLPPAWYPESIWSLPGNYLLVCVSEHQRRACPTFAQDRIAVLENGVPLPDAATLRAEGRYALMLARICPEKNVHVGLDAARRAGMPVLLGGDVFPYEAHERYFAEEVAPRLTASGARHDGRQGAGESPSARFLGPVAGEEKRRLLSRAACLLLPSLAPETSSLVAMEALAAGVPVIGLAVGAVPEIVEQGRTGFLIEPGERATEEMARAIGRVAELDRRACRAAAEARFPLNRMVEGYRRLYRELGPRRTSESLHAEKVSGLQDAAEPGCGPGDEQVSAEELGETAALQALAPEWARLWARDGSATPFQHPAWLLPWWRQFGPEGVLHAVALREEGTRELAGLLPLYAYRAPGMEERKLMLLGAGTADYLGGVWARDRAELAQRALRFVQAAVRDWDVAHLQQLRADSPLVEVARSASLPSSCAEPCSALDAARELPGKIRVNVNRYRRLAAKDGALACEVATTAEGALACFEELVGLHSRRWKERGEAGVLHDPRVLAHHRESLPLLLQAGVLRMFHLTLSGETIGVLYGLADGAAAAERRLYLYLIGFDGRFAALSPGSLLLQEAWLYARANGFRWLDLLRGGEEYKQLWGAREEATFAIELRRA